MLVSDVENVRPREVGEGSREPISRDQAAPAPSGVPHTRATPTVSVVIPTKNEALNVGWVLERLGPEVGEVIIVDGLSDDGTIEAALAARPDAVIVRQLVAGKGAAMRAGLARASGEYVIMIDADGSMDPAEIPTFVASLAGGSDLAKGSRFLPGGGSADITRLRAIGNAALTGFSNLLLGKSYSELCYGFMGVRRSRIDDLDLQSDGFEIETEIVVKACRAGFVISEIPSFESERRSGASNLNTFRDGWRVLRTLIGVRFAARSHGSTAPATSASIESQVSGSLRSARGTSQQGD